MTRPTTLRLFWVFSLYCAAGALPELMVEGQLLHHTSKCEAGYQGHIYILCSLLLQLQCPVKGMHLQIAFWMFRNELKDYVLRKLSLLKGLRGTSVWCWKAESKVISKLMLATVGLRHRLLRKWINCSKSDLSLSQRNPRSAAVTKRDGEGFIFTSPYNLLTYGQ